MRLSIRRLAAVPVAEDDVIVTCNIPSGQGEIMSRVRVTEACRGGEPSSYTVKGTVNLVPMDAVAVARLQGVRPTL